MEPKKHKCECDFCKRTWEFRKHIEHIEDDEAREWFEEFFGYVFEVEEDLEAYKIYNKNVKTLYPRIWKETTTITTLSKDEAEFPEKQI